MSRPATDLEACYRVFSAAGLQPQDSIEVPLGIALTETSGERQGLASLCEQIETPGLTWSRHNFVEVSSPVALERLILQHRRSQKRSYIAGYDSAGGMLAGLGRASYQV